DRGDLRAAVRRPGLLDVVHLVDVLVTGDDVRRDQPLVARDVGQPQAADHVADRVDVRLAGPHLPVHLDDALVDLDPRRLEADVLDIRRPAGRDEHDLGLDLFGGSAFGTHVDAHAVLGD